jgi:hypothetical protein
VFGSAIDSFLWSAFIALAIIAVFIGGIMLVVSGRSMKLGFVFMVGAAVAAFLSWG